MMRAGFAPASADSNDDKPHSLLKESDRITGLLASANTSQQWKRMQHRLTYDCQHGSKRITP